MTMRFPTAPSQPAAPEFETLLLEALPTIERIARAISRHHGLATDDADEFLGLVLLQLVENDYAILRKFRGQSSLSTYLRVVVSMFFRKNRREEWGRWRASAAALRSGAVAVRLEAFLLRDGLSLADAGQSLRTAGLTALSDRELARLASTFPRRTPLRPVVSSAFPPEAVAHSRADDLVEHLEATEEAATLARALHVALGVLTADDQLIVRMHFIEGLSVAEVARALAIPQKPLYRHVERVRSKLREELEHSGVSRDRVLSVASFASADAA